MLYGKARTVDMIISRNIDSRFFIPNIVSSCQCNESNENPVGHSRQQNSFFFGIAKKV